MNLATMPDLRAAVQRELDRRGWTAYRLIQELKGKRPKGANVPPQTVYRFLRAEAAINSDDLGLIFDALDMRVKSHR
jgi:hypothetical protein